ncbi:MAG: Na/Pi symporter [Moraxellaceae bacterium]|nr:Na/Pi symporter [Moraxellaceae bacterium]
MLRPTRGVAILAVFFPDIALLDAMTALVTQFLGGLGLFLLGMWLMTDGLKMAAGPALERILGQWTRTRARGLGAGILVTGLVQSSSAVTVATIGFVNAGLLTLGQAMWVIFGSNVGTTMTGWLVALIGFKFKIEAFALPLIGIGMLLRLTGEGSRRAAIGMTLAGFGALFVGIDVLRQAFDGLGGDLRFDAFAGMPFLGILMPVLAGILLTTLMQSSSAAMAVVLTAAAGGVVPLATAAAGVIGVNVGTTVTAVIAALAATPAARRTAGAHVAFNLLTGVTALVLLAPLLALIAWMTHTLEMDPSPPTVLAAFHTVFNVLGVLLMWPLSARLEAFLLTRFRTAEEDEGRAQHLDATLLGVPALAIDALVLEVRRLGVVAGRLIEEALQPLAAGAGRVARDHAILERLTLAIASFVAQLSRAGMRESSGMRLQQTLRLLRHYDTLGRLAVAVARQRSALTAPVPPVLALRQQQFCADVVAHINIAQPHPAAGANEGARPDSARLAAGLASLQQEYADLKNIILGAGAAGTLGVTAMDLLLEQARAARQAAEQATEAAAVLAQLAETAILPPAGTTATTTPQAPVADTAPLTPPSEIMLPLTDPAAGADADTLSDMSSAAAPGLEPAPLVFSAPASAPVVTPTPKDTP